MKNAEKNTINDLPIVKDYISAIPGTNEYEFILMLVDPNIKDGENCIISVEGKIEPTLTFINSSSYDSDTGLTREDQDQKVEISDLNFNQVYNHEGSIIKYAISYELYKRLSDYLENEFNTNFNDYYNNEYTSY